MIEMVEFSKWIALAEKTLEDLQRQDPNDRLSAWALIQRSVEHLKAVSETWLLWLTNPQYIENFTVKELSEAQYNFRATTVRLVQLTIESMRKHNTDKPAQPPPVTTA